MHRGRSASSLNLDVLVSYMVVNHLSHSSHFCAALLLHLFFTCIIDAPKLPSNPAFLFLINAIFLLLPLTSCFFSGSVLEIEFPCAYILSLS